MEERKDLIALCANLKVGSPIDIDNLTNNDLLKLILQKLNGQSSIDNLPDSLAFPQAARDRLKSIDHCQHWDRLKTFNDLLRQDYSYRRQMLLNRLDCTIESFTWKASEKSTQPSQAPSKTQNKQSTDDLVHERYNKARAELHVEPDVTLGLLLATRETDCDKMLNGIVGSRGLDSKLTLDHTDSSGKLVNLKQINIPDVPDRGGRPNEIRAPAKESFAHQRRSFGRGSRR